MSALDNLGPQEREIAEREIEEAYEKGKKIERTSVVTFLRSRVGFWNSNSNVNKKIKRLADDIESGMHHRVQQDKKENGDQ